MAVICAGAKSILDIPRTLEVLVRSPSPFLELKLMYEGDSRCMRSYVWGQARFPRFLHSEFRSKGTLLAQTKLTIQSPWSVSSASGAASLIRKSHPPFHQTSAN